MFASQKLSFLTSDVSFKRRVPSTCRSFQAIPLNPTHQNMSMSVGVLRVEANFMQKVRN